MSIARKREPGEGREWKRGKRKEERGGGGLEMKRGLDGENRDEVKGEACGGRKFGVTSVPGGSKSRKLYRRLFYAVGVNCWHGTGHGKWGDRALRQRLVRWSKVSILSFWDTRT